MKSKNTVIVFINIFVIAFSAFSSALCFLLVDYNKSKDYIMSFLSPLSFVIVYVIFINFVPKMLSRINMIVILSTYFVRMVIVPVLQIYGDYTSYIPDTIVCNGYYFHAVILTSYEFFLVTLVMAYMCNNSNTSLYMNYGISNSFLVSDNRYQKTDRAFILVVLLLSYELFMIILDPKLLNNVFSLLFGTPKNWYQRVEARELGSDSGGVLGVMVTMMNIVFWQIQAILPLTFVLGIRKLKLCRCARNLSIIITFFIIVMISSGTKIHSFECAVAFMLSIYFFYGEDIIGTLYFTFITCGLAGVLGVMTKNNQEFSLTAFAKVIPAYFGGMPNVSAAMYYANNSDTYGKSSIISDIISSIPLVGTRLSKLLDISENTGKLFNLAIAQGGKTIGQIIPSIGQGYSYFGFILAPIIPIMLCILSCHFDKKAFSEDRLIIKNVYIIGGIMIARSCVMTNLMSATNYLFSTLLSLLILGSIGIKPQKSNVCSLEDISFVR